MAYAYRDGKSIYIGYTDKRGEPVREKSTARTLREGKELAAEKEKREERIRLGLEVDLERVPFEALCEQYLRMYAPGKKSFAADKGRIENHLLPHFKGWFLDEMTAAEIRAFLLSELKQKPRGTVGDIARRDAKLKAMGKEPKPPELLSKATREQLRVLLQGMLSFAINELGIAKGPNEAAKVEKIGAAKRAPKVLEPEEAQAIVWHVRDEDRGLFAMAAGTGLRKSELLRLRPEDVNLEQQWVCVQAVDDDETPKDGEIRYVPLPDWLVPFLRVELGRVRSEWLFPALDGSKRDPASFDTAEIFRTAMKRAGVVLGFDHVCRRRGCKQSVERRADAAPRPCPLCGMQSWPRPVPKPYTFKTFRSTYGTIGFESTGDIRFAQNSLGHSDAKTTEHYAKRRNRHMLRQANQMPALVPQFTQPALSGSRLPPAPASNVTAISTAIQGTYNMRADGIEPSTYGLRDRTPQKQADNPGSNQSLSLAFARLDPCLQSLPVAPLSTISHGFTQPALSAVSSGSVLLTAEQVAELLQLNRETIYRMAKRGELRPVRFGASLRFERADIEALLAGRGRP